MKWAYGITATPRRIGVTLERTVKSLARAGFDKPHIFMDGWFSSSEFLGLPITARSASIGIVGNWMAGMWELYVKNPESNRYAMFQDDVLAVSNLREYLERCYYPECGYLNLYTFKENLILAKGECGWHFSNQRGMGALGLVFSRDALIEVLKSEHMTYKPSGADVRSRTTKLDGGVFTAMKAAGYKEFTHNPSLLQHQISLSTVGHCYGGVESFPGEDFNALSIIEQNPPTPPSGEPPPYRAPYAAQSSSFLEKALTVVGVDRAEIDSWLGESCCEELRNKLRSLKSWSKRVCRGDTADALKYLHLIIGKRND